MPRQNCLVTGANRGLGLEFCRQLLARGDHVIATARQPGHAHELSQLAGENPGRLHVLPLDVSNAKSELELARELPLVLGDEPLHMLINNAGLLHAGERFGQVSAASLADSFRTNAAGPFLVTQALASRLATGAKVANISSQLGSIAATTQFSTPSYCVSKAALNMATRLLSAALEDRSVTVLALHPGWVATSMGGASAPLEPVQSVTGLLRVIDAATLGDSGSFIDWQGKSLAW